MLIRTRLFLIGFLPALLLLALGGAYLTSQSHLDAIREKTALADQLGKKIFELTALSHDLTEVKSARPHQQWSIVMQEVQAQLPKAKATFSGADERELLELFVEQFESARQSFQELAQWREQSQDKPTAAQQFHLGNLIQRIQSSLDSALPITGKIHTINDHQALLFAERQKLVMIILLIFLCAAIPLIVWPMMRHITRTTAELAAQEAKFRTVADYTFNWEYWLGPDRQILYMSPSCERITGYALAEFEADPELLNRIVLPADRNVMEAHLHNDTYHDEALVDFRILHRDGGIRWITHGCRAIYGENGQFKGRRVSNRDDTERKLAELQVKQSTQQLQESETALIRAQSVAHIGSWHLDLRGNGLTWSAETYRIFGVTGNVPLAYEDFLACIHLEDRNTVDAAWQAAMKGAPYDITHRIIVDSQIKWVREQAELVFDSAGQLSAGVGTVQDITPQVLAEQELKRSNAELEQFSYSISHDMRQPLRMISSYLQLLKKSLAGQLDGDKQEYFKFAIDGAQRLDQMLVALLEYSRVGRKGEPPDWVESRALLDEALLFLQPAIAEAQAEVKIFGDWPRVYVSRDEIMRLIQNLIGNAVKYRVAGRTPEISVTSETNDNDWRLSIADNGVGILPDQTPRLFQVFQRLHARAAYEGTGIGLALCRKIVEHHGGHIAAESAGEGHGSTFRVVLPLRREKSINTGENEKTET